MARIPVIAASGGLAIVAASVLAGSANAANPLDPAPVPLDAFYNTLSFVIVGSTEADRKLQWIDDAEALLPEKPALPQIKSDTWLPHQP